MRAPSLDYQGVWLDLWGLSFAPAGGNVTSDVYEDISIHIAHSPVRPVTALREQVLSRAPDSGLSPVFDFATYFATTVQWSEPLRSSGASKGAQLLRPQHGHDGAGRNPLESDAGATYMAE